MHIGLWSLNSVCKQRVRNSRLWSEGRHSKLQMERDTESSFSDPGYLQKPGQHTSLVSDYIQRSLSLIFII